jgi:uncharacterized protein YjiS (DUF1127 family)
MCRQQQNGVVMALIQTDRDNVIRFGGPVQSHAPIRPVAQVLEHVIWLVQGSLARLAQWSAQRRARNGLTMAERARQRRELAQLSDRELSDIGITRYDIEFVLRRARQR